MMEQDEFRALALTFPEAVGMQPFRHGRLPRRRQDFATLREADGRAVLKLSPDEQQLVMATSPGMFEPVKGSWGLKGWTRVTLGHADAGDGRATPWAWPGARSRRRSWPWQR